ncbi:MAG: hypothetical protein ABSF25_20560 [Bryobacteraceae bacterium]|jgi:hypothetical protein
MSIEIAHDTEVRLIGEARRQGISVDALLERLITEREPTALDAGPLPELPTLHLGAMGAFHRRDIYDDAG